MTVFGAATKSGKNCHIDAAASMLFGSTTKSDTVWFTTIHGSATDKFRGVAASDEDFARLDDAVGNVRGTHSGDLQARWKKTTL